MPNRTNLTAPICLVGLGRSGTTLVTNIFRRHPGFQSLGETANLVYSTFRHIEKSLPISGPRNQNRSDQDVARLRLQGPAGHLCVAEAQLVSKAHTDPVNCVFLRT
ncbi:sulfotransferase [Fluviibacterium sp. MJW13]|uniref:sulfotransferase n=1 Tax=Meridianimarinicoccus sp. MJW13 TaxID=2720031 RepID=UPI0018683535